MKVGEGFWAHWLISGMMETSLGVGGHREKELDASGCCDRRLLKRSSAIFQCMSMK